MPKSLLSTTALGPFDGLLDTKGASVPAPGKLKNMQNLVFRGGNEIVARLGTSVALTLKDDAGTPANVTKVLYIGTFMDGGIAIAHSTATDKCYLYRLPATMDGWYDSTGTLQSTTSPEPCLVLWSGMTAPPDVSCAEGLGTLYVANTSAIDAAGLYYATQAVTFSSAGVPSKADLSASGTDGVSAGSDVAYFTLVCSFHQGLFGVGYGAGNTVGYSSYRPELLRFSPPSFGNLQLADSIVVGDRVRALRERTVGMAVAGNALFLLATKALFRITGYGRDSWFVETLDERYGATGPKAYVAVGGTLYYWSSRGPMRVTDAFGSAPDPLWDAVVGVVGSVANESHIVASYDSRNDLVWFAYDAGDSSVHTLCTFDVRRNAFTSGDGEVGLGINCAGVVEPIYASAAAPPAGPPAPVVVSTTSITNTTAVCTWTESDATAQIEVTFRQQGTSSYYPSILTAPGATTYTLSTLAVGTAYEWRVRALRGGLYSAYAGPVAASQFTTTGAAVTPPTAPDGLSAVAVGSGSTQIRLTWTNTETDLAVQILRSAGGPVQSDVGTAPATAVSYVDDPGAHGTFTYQVRYIAADGTLGDRSDFASATTTAY